MIRAIMIILVALVLAGISVAATASGVFKSRAPQTALSFWPKNGLALARLADLQYGEIAISNDKPVSAQTESRVREVSLLAYRLEPLAANAIRNLGLMQERDGDLATARQLVRSANKLNSRDIASGFWLIQDYGRLGDVDAILKAYDKCLRVSEAARNVLLPQLRSGLAAEEMVEPTVQLLATQPPWRSSFWGQTPEEPAALANIAIVRGQLHERKVADNQRVDQGLIDRLIRLEMFEEAKGLFDAATEVGRTDSRIYTLNGDFSQVPSLSPFAWRMRRDGAMNAFISTSGTGLEVEVFENGGGIFARQLLQLPEGALQLTAIASEIPEEFSDILFIRLRCASSQVQNMQSITFDLDQRSISRDFYNDGRCGWYWLDLGARTLSGAREFRTELLRVDIAAE